MPVVRSQTISKLDFFFSVLFLCGLYTGIYFYFSDTLFIPFAICGVTAPYFLYKIRHELNPSYFTPLIYLYAVTMLGMFFAPEVFEQFFERFKGIVQLIYSTSVAFLFFINMRKWKPELVSKLFMGFVIFIIIGTILEVYTPFKYISDEFRHWVFRKNLYEVVLRDISFYGKIRPKLFTSEPSHVAKFFILSLFVWFALSKNNWRYSIYSLFMAAGFFTIRSPIIILSIPLAFVIEVFFRKGINLSSIITKKKPILRGSLVVISLIFVLFIIVSLNTIFAERTRAVIAGTDGSFVGRITGPSLLAFNTVKKYPIWGAGITSKEAIADIIYDSYWALGVTKNDIDSAGCNSLMLFISYYGMLGGGLFIVVFIVLLKRLGITNGMFVMLSIFIFGQTMGAFVGLRVWGYVFIILLISSYSRYYVDSEKETTGFVRSCSRASHERLESSYRGD